MGKRLRKRRGIGALAVKDEAQPEAARTSGGRRILKRRKVAVATGEYQISHLELRSRSVVLKPRIARSAANSGGRRKSTAGLARISRCSSNDSCEATPELDTETFFRCNEERKETAASSNHGDDASDLESTVEMESRSRSTLVAMPSESELEEFFAAAERDLRRQFAERYNFDVVKDAPLAGRYEWIPLAP